MVDTFYSPFTNSFTIGGTCEVFRYAFDTAGNLLRQEDTGEIPCRIADSLYAVMVFQPCADLITCHKSSAVPALPI